MRRFGLKTEIDFAHFGLESGMVFEGTTGIYERIYRFNSKWIKKSHDSTLLKVYIASNQDVSFHLLMRFCYRINLVYIQGTNQIYLKFYFYFRLF